MLTYFNVLVVTLLYLSVTLSILILTYLTLNGMLAKKLIKLSYYSTVFPLKKYKTTSKSPQAPLPFHLYFSFLIKNGESQLNLCPDCLLSAN